MMREERMEGMYAELIPAGAMKLHGLLREAGIEAYFVGGCVRDLIMGRKAKDWDMCCGAEPQALIGLLEDNDLKADSKWLQYDMVVTENEGETIEIRSFRRAADPLTGEKKRDLRTDLKARDFTMNAMAYDPLDGRVIDLLADGRILPPGASKRWSRRMCALPEIRLPYSGRFGFRRSWISI